ncbi:hypothetical protein V502_02309 [Pseudogymnoascus sp. VKM F-4520 (FW-2644)]|nr:hypothetical protein V502_02309 [Pseudogymnoascus sp. VKM F-4520 (FW-2644)]
MAANANRMPPPPPNHGFQQAPPGMVQGGPPMNRPQQPQQPRQQQYAPAPVYQQNFQQGGPVPAYRADTVINASTRIHDIRPEKTESESFCKKQLTSYEVFTLLPSNDDDGKDSKGSKGNKDSKDSKDKKKDNWSGWGSKDGKDKDDSKSKKRERWAKVTINQESYPTEQIIKTIQKLDAGKLSITEKKARLFPNQSTQVTNILDSKIMTEREGQIFEWVLAQLHREESTNSKTGKKETTSMTIYLKRAPLPGVDVIQLYRERQERARLQALHRQQAQIFQQQQQQQQQAQAMQQQQQQMGGGQYMPQNNKGVYQQQQPKGDPSAKPVKNKNAPAGVKIVQDHRPGTPGGHKSPKGGKVAGHKVRMMNDSDGYSSGSFSDSDSNSDSDSDFSRIYDSDATPHTSASSRSGGRKYPGTHRPLERSRERRRGNYHNRGEDFVIVDRPPRSSRRHSVSYAPDVPHFDRPLAGARVNSYGQPSPAIGNPGFDTEAFAMGVAAATRAAIAQPAIVQPAIVQPATQYAAPPQRMISNIERAADDDARFREEQRRLNAAEDIMREDALREAMVRENAARISRPYERDPRSDGGRGGYAPRRYLDEDRERLYRDPPMSPSVSSMSSAPLSSLPRERGRSDRWSPELRRRSNEYEYPLRGGLQRIPLEEDREFDYVRNPNPFQPRREPRPYRY